MQTHYLYMYNTDGTDYISCNAISTNPKTVEQLALVTLPNADDEDFGGIPLAVDDWMTFCKVILRATTTKYPLYIGYYFDEFNDRYTLIVDSASYARNTIYDKLGMILIHNQVLDETEITDEMEDGQIKDVENVIIDHEGGHIEIPADGIAQLKQRILEQ